MVGIVVHPHILVSQEEVAGEFPTLVGATAKARILSKSSAEIFSVYARESSGNCSYWKLKSSWREGQRIGEVPVRKATEFSRSRARARAAGAK